MHDVGVIGLGQMGGGMARAFADAGRTVHVYDVRDEAVREAAEAHSSIVATASAREVAERSDVVVVSVYSASDSEAALLDPQTGALAGQVAGKITVDTTTSTLEATQRVAEAYRARGVGFLAAPVSGRPPHLTIMAGGDRDAFDASASVLADIGDRSIYLGSAAAACVTKHINQFLTRMNFLVACEGIVAGARAGVPLQGLAEVLAGGSGNSMALGFALAEVSDQASPLVPAPLRLVAKDVRLASENLASVGVPSEMMAQAVEVYTAAEQSVGAEPFPALLRIVAERYGVDPQLLRRD